MRLLGRSCRHKDQYLRHRHNRKRQHESNTCILGTDPPQTVELYPVLQQKLHWCIYNIQQGNVFNFLCG